MRVGDIEEDYSMKGRFEPVREKISVEVITWVLSVQKRLYLS